MDKSLSSYRQNFLISLLSKVMQEYKKLLELSRHNKPFKITEIIELSNVPGETVFAVQLLNKNCVIPLKTSEIFSKGYNLDEFTDVHAEMICQAAKGTLLDFLNQLQNTSSHKIIWKKFDKNLQQYVFGIETKSHIRFKRTADEIATDKNLLFSFSKNDLYDIAFTQGTESILKERLVLFSEKNK
ncbi:MAG: hypothetical protein JO149_02270 [Gammaproteobacteria bacterium]|nr:hypothetical protein [Gammaproteobacteria bacterium]